MTCIHPLSIQVCLLPTISLPHHLLYYHQAKLLPLDPHPPLPDSSLDWNVSKTSYPPSSDSQPSPQNYLTTPTKPQTLLHVTFCSIAFGIPPFLTEMYPTALINSSHQYKNALCVNLRAPVFHTNTIVASLKLTQVFNKSLFTFLIFLS